jgi:hypothetical protein
MAKGIDINGQLRGKRGGVVYYRANGQQISRSRNFNPYNPQTMAQMLQRLALANASKASKGLKEIIDHSFEGVRYGADSVRNFESKAQLALKAAIAKPADASQVCAFVPMDALGFPVAEFLISTGSLPSANGHFVRRPSNGAVYMFQADGTLPEGVTGATITPRQFCACLGVSTDAQLTFVHCKGEDSVGGAGSEVIFEDNILHSIVRINFDQTKLDEPMLDEGAIKPSVLVADKSQNVDLYEVGIVDGVMTLLNDNEFSAAALIVSRYVDGQWRRSTEKLTIAATEGTESIVLRLEVWGWNYYDDVVRTLFKGGAVVEDRLLNKEDNAN